MPAADHPRSLLQATGEASGQRSSGVIRGLVVFDLDGTLLRGDTVCEVLAKPLGRLAEMRRFEQLTAERDIAQARAEMAKWYANHTTESLCLHLRNACWAPGAREAISGLQRANVLVAIASMTWSAAVRWFAEALNVTHYLGTDIGSDGRITHVWGRNKARWLQDLAAAHRVAAERTAAVGDSAGDTEMLSAANLRFFVGQRVTPGLKSVVHWPDADLRLVSEHIIDAWAA